MMRSLRNNLFYLFLLAIVASCTDNSEDTGQAFGDLLAEPPYSAITDSIRKEPGRDDLYFRRAVMLNRNNQPEPALADFRKAWSLEADERYAVGVSNLLLEKNLDSAILFLQEAMGQIPASIFLPITLARAYEAAEKPAKAIEVCDSLLAREPMQVNALVLKAEILEQMGNNQAAAESLKKAYSIMPASAEISNKLAYLYAELKDPKALQLADSLIAVDSFQRYIGAHYIKGVYYTNINKPELAIRAFDETIKNDHRYLNAYLEKGKILFNQGKTNKALEVFQQANVVTPSFPDAWYWIGRCMEKKGQKEEARLNYERAYELDKTFIEAKDAAAQLDKFE